MQDSGTNLPHGFNARVPETIVLADFMRATMMGWKDMGLAKIVDSGRNKGF